SDQLTESTVNVGSETRRNSNSGKPTKSCFIFSLKGKGVLCFHTDTSHGIQIGLFMVLIINIFFIALVIFLHIWTK
uniref:Uncharacterized protein n=1 Tax=Apteryx owenii TaxID=8824 RepID=A0A8B9PWW6_APTOW